MRAVISLIYDRLQGEKYKGRYKWRQYWNSRFPNKIEVLSHARHPKDT